MIITIDGPSGTGKSTVAKQLATVLNFSCFDTGALYRAIAWKILHDEIPLTDREAIEIMLEAFSFRVETHRGNEAYFVDQRDVTHAIRSREVTAIVSEVSAMKSVRDAMRPLQEAFAKQGSTVFEGRDLGTVIFPHAEVKFFMTACAEVRARRRLKDLQQTFPMRAAEFSYEEVLKNIKERDKEDSVRTCAPLKRARDAILVDTSDLTIEEVVSILATHVRRHFL